MQVKHLLFFPVIWLAISSASILVVLSGAPGEVNAFWRMFLSSLLLLPSWLEKKPQVRLHHVASGAALAFHFILWMKSLFMVSVYTSTLLVVLYPLYSLLLEVALYSYRPSGLQLLGFTTSVLSLVFYIGVNRLAFNPGAISSLAAGFSVAVYFEIGRYARSTRGETLADYAFPTYLTAAVFTLAYNITAGLNPIPGNPVSYVYFALMALIPMMLGHTLMNYLLRYYPAHLVTSVSLGEPFGAGLLAHVILGQVIALSDLVAGAIIILSLALIIYGYRGGNPGSAGGRVE